MLREKKVKNILNKKKKAKLSVLPGGKGSGRPTVIA
jgi:hypothetical protein